MAKRMEKCERRQNNRQLGPYGPRKKPHAVPTSEHRSIPYATRAKGNALDPLADWNVNKILTIDNISGHFIFGNNQIFGDRLLSFIFLRHVSLNRSQLHTTTSPKIRQEGNQLTTRSETRPATGDTSPHFAFAGTTGTRNEEQQDFGCTDVVITGKIR